MTSRKETVLQKYKRLAEEEISIPFSDNKKYTSLMHCWLQIHKDARLDSFAAANLKSKVDEVTKYYDLIQKISEDENEDDEQNRSTQFLLIMLRISKDKLRVLIDNLALTFSPIEDLEIKEIPLHPPISEERDNFNWFESMLDAFYNYCSFDYAVSLSDLITVIFLIDELKDFKDDLISKFGRSREDVIICMLDYFKKNGGIPYQFLNRVYLS